MPAYGYPEEGNDDFFPALAIHGVQISLVIIQNKNIIFIRNPFVF
jgi:hypothetical protein